MDLSFSGKSDNENEMKLKLNAVSDFEKLVSMRDEAVMSNDMSKADPHSKSTTADTSSVDLNDSENSLMLKNMNVLSPNYVMNVSDISSATTPPVLPNAATNLEKLAST